MVPAPVVFLLLLLFPFMLTTHAQKYYAFRCSDNYTSGGVYQQTLAATLLNLTAEAALSDHLTASYGDPPYKVYSGYFCRADIQLDLCHDCLGNATQMISRICPDQIAGLIWYDVCTVGYSPVQFSSVFVPYYKVAIRSNQNVSGDARKFDRLVNSTMEEVAAAAVADKIHASRFATRDANFTGGVKVYCLAQCSPILAAVECGKCLRAGIDMLPGYCSGRDGGRVLLSSCVLRYEIFPFYNSGAQTYLPGVPDGRKHKKLYVAGIIGGLGGSMAILLVLGILIIVHRRKKKKTTAVQKANKADMKEINSAESLQFDFNRIRAATKNFSDDNKLGRGGFGVVYKGTLDNGQELAVKRLSETSGQGTGEFKTEVVLVAKLQHRNLVKLLGFCLSGEEKLLVYEYLPNSSLDKFLSEPKQQASLDWATRFKIICGIARGLLYLHEDSRLKIIHRDLKSSNILLDEAMNPKISDFGLAKLFGVDQTQDDTNRIVGTYGYMAPEYALAGHFSVKSDVYSFGIIVLELVSGQKNRFFTRPQDEVALQFRAWNLWNKEEPLKLVDPCLGMNYSTEEVIKCIQIGLLCIQDEAGRRPGMALVVAALRGQSVGLSPPLLPSFISGSTSSTGTSFMCSEPSGITSEYSDSSVLRKRMSDDESQYTATGDITQLYPR